MGLTTGLYLLALTSAAAPSAGSATLADRQNLCVPRINALASNRSQGIGFAESPSAASGSYSTYRNTTLPDRSYQQMSAMPLTAKATGQTMRIMSDVPGRNIANGSYSITQLEFEP